MLLHVGLAKLDKRGSLPHPHDFQSAPLIHSLAKETNFASSSRCRSQPPSIPTEHQPPTYPFHRNKFAPHARSEFCSPSGLSSDRSHRASEIPSSDRNRQRI